jgi:hypothetical protein
LTEAREAIARTESDLATRSEEMKEAFEKQLREDRQSFEETQLAQKEKHRAEISQEASRTLQLQSEVEEETGKRRKAERAKKFYEAEAQRLKTQLQVFASSAGSGSAAGDPMATKDIASVIKEMKAMQQELDEANKEICFLRSRGNCNTVPVEDSVKKGVTSEGAPPPAHVPLHNCGTASTASGIACTLFLVGAQGALTEDSGSAPIQDKYYLY